MVKKLLFIFLGFSLVFTGCGKKEQAKKTGVVLYYSGCGITKKAFMAELAKAYGKETGVFIDVSGGGATKGIRNAASKTTQVGGSCRHVLDVPEEKNIQTNIVAWDALVVIVHKSNPIKNISEENLKKVLTGKITNWKKLGGKDAPIQVVARKGKISGVGRMTRELIFGNTEADYTAKAIRYPSSGPLEKAVEKIENAIGITGISSGRKRDVNFLSINSMAPSYENIASGKYPFFRPLYLVIHNDASEDTKKFIAFAKSSKGQQIIKAQNTVIPADALGLMDKFNRRMESLGVKNWK